ncbi:MAG TPA: SUMF1/EgtB/PvdO family nonheme iron enzyme [Polyangiaceae bacterium]|nr:SUMF1/EgtB/PvdO family nonheme iron enzyme [Polyangiaceae bacterium]
MSRRAAWTRGLGGGLVVLVGSSACSGEAFRLSESTDPIVRVPDSGRFPALVTNSSHPDAEAPSEGTGGSASTVSTGNESDAGSEPVLPPLGPCGDPRSPSESLADTEVCVPAGNFSMGSGDAIKPGYLAHGPPHSVTLSAYFLDAYEVTVARFRRCVEAGACTAAGVNATLGCTYTLQPGAHELHPVTCVPWQSARDFCTWDGGRRLPTEAEWERAARNDAASKYPWGDTFACDQAVLAGAGQCAAYAGTLPQPVGSAAAGISRDGAFDLVGNTAEWVADWFGGYSAAAATDPTGPSTGSARIQRGGGWLTLSADATGFARRAEAPAASGSFSFRCARDAQP